MSLNSECRRLTGGHTAVTQRVSWLPLPRRLLLVLCGTLLERDLSEQSQVMCLKLQCGVYVYVVLRDFL